MNCKPGQMAIIVGSLHTPENIGRIVDVVSVAYDYEAFPMIGGKTVLFAADGSEVVWRVRSDMPLKWRAGNGEVLEACEIATGDRFLRPVSGLPVEDDVRDEVTA